MSARFDERGFLEKWCEEFSRAVEMFSGSAATATPESESVPVPSTSDLAGYLWWKQAFTSGRGGFTTWVGAPKETWQTLGSSMAEGADGAKPIYLEILGQAEQGAATLLSQESGQPVQCEQGQEEETCSSAVSQAWQIKIGFYGKNLPSIVCLIDASSIKTEVANQLEKVHSSELVPGRHIGVNASGVEQLLDLELPLSVVLGRSVMKIQSILKLNSGSVVELDSTIFDHVEVLVHGKVVAKGEVVSVKGNYGVRITELVPGKIASAKVA